MSTGQRRSVLSYIPGYKNNAVLKLIIFSGVAYMTLAVIWAIMMIVYGSNANFEVYFMPNIALNHVYFFKTRFWTIFSYGFFLPPNNFLQLATSMMWLYFFGSVVQSLVGYRQVIPLYLYGLASGGLFYYITQFFPGRAAEIPGLVMGPQTGIVAMAAAAITVSPSYRFYISERLSIPLWAPVAIFGFLAVLGSGFFIPVLVMLVAGGFTGFVYIRALRLGYQPSAWIYNTINSIEGLVTPAAERPAKRKKVPFDPNGRVPQSHIDEILDKINQKGYNSLSREEKEMLLRAGDK